MNGSLRQLSNQKKNIKRPKESEQPASESMATQSTDTSRINPSAHVQMMKSSLTQGGPTAVKMIH